MEGDAASGRSGRRTVVVPGQNSDDRHTSWCREQCKLLGLEGLAGRVVVDWNARLRTTAGRAFPASGRLELNPKLSSMGDDEVDRTLRHELAHLVAHERAKGREIAAHGPEWQLACAELGIAGERARHTLPWARGRQRRRYAYRCPGCGIEIHRVRRIRRPAACSACCRRHAGGGFDPRFRLVERALSDGLK